MPTEEIYPGKVFRVRGWLKDGKCQVLDFLETLERDADSDAERLYNIVVRVADNGTTQNQRHIKSLYDNIFEFKAPNTGRILFFYDKGQLIICSHGFTGKKGNGQKFIAKQIKKAVDIRNSYFDEIGEENEKR